MAPKVPTLKGKKSNLGKLLLSSSPSDAPSSNSRSATPRSDASTPRIGQRHTPGSLRTLLGRLRDKQPEFEMLSPSSSSLAPEPSPPKISKLAKAFVDSLTTQQLSNFLTWMLYYDVVELPDSPTMWYEMINSMEMRGWVALGEFLFKAVETGYGFDLIVLDSICDRINLKRTTVHDLLMQFANPKMMAFTQSATTIRAATAEGKSELEVFEAAQAKLYSLHKLATNLKPTENSIYDVWHAMVQKRLRGFQHLVIGPRIAHLRSGVPLITAPTPDQSPKEIQDSIKLKYLYEAMQQERRVPLVRYGIHSGATARVHPTPPSSPLSTVSDQNDIELARSHAIQLMKANQDLHAQVAKLTRENEELTESNDSLARKIATLGGIQPASYASPAHLQVPQARGRPRSLSHGTGEKLAAEVNAKLNISQRSHKRKQSEILSWKYEDIFSPLEGKPMPALRLSDPATAELVAPNPPPAIPHIHSPRPVSHTSNRTRRSGMIFDPASVAHLASVGESTPHVVESDDEQNAVEVSTPTPLMRQRLNYE
ncbi:uncharacterized protein K460DRAFT_401201 [Cucurbitaria berberidis CBS 394.84]|uniref:Uncharacterized protein n=1 Tax=Cucurbitaria berberidis CBS 394.84 TaxID=1168544 RepID=A0A9P4GSZ4_9PLEO|nr:uncharacterized protein K460DRAFT_401201 [Cucurbitaria berberidis CBS 394.84]KAF1851175.1 hypothetical protein K460DRAFT_401201 [Cucurbitaria berberidis CBS 394.84]